MLNNVLKLYVYMVLCNECVFLFLIIWFWFDLSLYVLKWLYILWFCIVDWCFFYFILKGGLF